jgi:hypothetical protein
MTAIAALTCFFVGCGRTKQQAVVIVPDAPSTPVDVPGDPFGSSSAAYERLREVTDAALAMPWDGELESFAPWLEEQTVAVERSLSLLKALRVGPQDVYAVANGRVALVYTHIATALTEASTVAESEGYVADWTGQQSLIWQQANAFWARCARGCSMGGTHLDAWDLRCRRGLADSEPKTKP